MSNLKLNAIAALAVTLGLSLTLLTAPVSAMKKGPRASVSSATACALSSGVDGNTVLAVTTTLTNKSSGIVIPEVRGGEIKGTYKPKDSRGKAYRSLGTVDIDKFGNVNPKWMFTAEFPLCNADGSVLEEVRNARELNGKSMVDYGISGGDGEMRTVTNRCTDDPDTLDVNEGGIRVADVIDSIVCLPLAPD